MSLTKRIRVMLADDHPIMRDGLRDALQDEGDFEVVGSGRRRGRGGDHGAGP